MKTHLITVTNVSEEREDKNGRTYKNVEFSNPDIIEVVDQNTGEVLKVRVEAKKSTITRYKEDYLNDKQQFMYDAQIGERTLGMVVSLPVLSYEIDGKNVSSYSTVVFGDINSKLWRSKVIQAFKRNGHELIEYLPPEQIENAYVNESIQSVDNKPLKVPSEKKLNIEGAYMKVDSKQEEDEDTPVAVEFSNEVKEVKSLTF